MTPHDRETAGVAVQTVWEDARAEQAEDRGAGAVARMARAAVIEQDKQNNLIQ